MTYVEDARQLLIDCVLLVERGVLPVERMTRRGVETAFADGDRLGRHAFSSGIWRIPPLSRLRERAGVGKSRFNLPRLPASGPSGHLLPPAGEGTFSAADFAQRLGEPV